ncbi:MAG: hypothetical protein QNJ48_07830 [Desulfobacterales bacterium]|nr:hypothetical protein [Desulfobacterales bacterium]
MKKLMILTGLLLALGLIAAPAMGGDFDGSKKIICAAVDVVECAPGAECDRVMASEIDFPDFVRLDFKKKEIRTEQSGHEKRKTDIERIERISGKMIIQGAENAHEGASESLGWSMIIDEENGRFVLSAAATEAAFVVFGTCTVP